MKRSLQAVLFGAALLAGAPAFAGSGNVLYLTQQSEGAGGNTFQSDQDAGSYTSIGSSGAPALQHGSFNDADITLSGNCTLAPQPCGTLALMQDNSTVIGGALGNSASATITGHGNGGIIQTGDDNTAILLLGDVNGTINQLGSDNFASLNATTDVGGSITQTGEGNTANLIVGGFAGSTFSLTQSGGKSLGTEAAAATIVTTHAGATIEQY